ncbi:hypothetical protein ACFVWR_04815 [Leifsonia sp. NPDC058292]|uniref:hypothetical protein n=1 Tax=Leifsonia sp. NPDC058292 TaxID=3346428 RepID=UPI0036DC8190
MGRARRLPQGLSGGAFSTGEALAQGVLPGRLRANDIEHPFHGVNAHDAPVGVIERCVAYLARLRDGQVFSHETAAAIYGMPLGRSSGRRPPQERPLHVSVPFPRTPPRARGVVGHCLSEPSGQQDSRNVRGLPVCPPLLVWRQLAATSSPVDLVAIGDFIAGSRARAPLASLAEVRAAAAQCARGTSGAAALRWAAERVRFGADSHPESLLRLAVVESGLPEPIPNPPIMMTDDTVFHPDLVFATERVILEYEGDGHRTSAWQWMHDIRRHDAMVAAGWRVVRVTRTDLFPDPTPLIRRLSAIIRARS